MIVGHCFCVHGAAKVELPPPMHQMSPHSTADVIASGKFVVGEQ